MAHLCQRFVFSLVCSIFYTRVDLSLFAFKSLYTTVYTLQQKRNRRKEKERERENENNAKWPCSKRKWWFEWSVYVKKRQQQFWKMYIHKNNNNNSNNNNNASVFFQLYGSLNPSCQMEMRVTFFSLIYYSMFVFLFHLAFNRNEHFYRIFVSQVVDVWLTRSLAWFIRLSTHLMAKSVSHAQKRTRFISNRLFICSRFFFFRFD